MRPLEPDTKQSLTILGLNSGTSADGLDMAVVRVPRSSKKPVVLLHSSSKRYSAAIRKEVLALADSSSTTLEQLIATDALLGEFFGREAASYLKNLRAKRITVDAVASHGQTIRHMPRKRSMAGMVVHGTLQIGSLARIAAHTGKVAVGDFRQADIALGNEGAPITVAAVVRLFQHPRVSRLVVNVGGMANFFYIPAGGKISKVRAADCGPGNVLSDLLSQKLFGKRFDNDGKLARNGAVSQRLLATLTALKFFRDTAVSTGREQFGAELAAKMIREGKRLKLSSHDLLATAIELTAFGISRKVRPIVQHDRSIRSLYLTGGGAYNSFLRERVSASLNGFNVSSVHELGMDPSMTEAASYAVMGASCLWSQPLATRFGGRQKRLPILGTIAQPPV